jgi:hypothetical protein
MKQNDTYNSRQQNWPPQGSYEYSMKYQKNIHFNMCFFMKGSIVECRTDAGQQLRDKKNTTPVTE